MPALYKLVLYLKLEQYNVPVVSSATPSADSAVVPASVIPELIPLSAEGYGSVRAHPAVAPSLDMWFNESCKVYGFIFAIVPRVKSLPGHLSLIHI